MSLTLCQPVSTFPDQALHVHVCLQGKIKACGNVACNAEAVENGEVEV
jgi:hypothetical protein